MSHTQRTLIASAALAALLGLSPNVPAGAGPGVKPIQPGARLTRPDIEPLPSASPFKAYRCTMTFIFTDRKRNLYTGTTGETECVEKVGKPAWDENGKRIGLAVFQEFSPPEGSFTLIRIDRNRRRDVSAAVRGWGGPTGIEKTGATGDVVLFTGNGFVEGELDQTRPRAGVLVSLDEKHFTADTVAELGDSGAPVIDEKTGAAIGMISDFGTADSPPTTDDGPSLARILKDCAAKGFKLKLLTAPFTKPF